MPHLQPLFAFSDPVTSAVATGESTTVTTRPLKGGAGGGGAPPASTVHAESREQRLRRVLAGVRGNLTTAARLFDEREYQRLTRLHEAERAGRDR